MLTTKEISKDEFDTWKESSNWFFDYFKELLTSIDQEVDAHAKHALVCDSQYLDSVRLGGAGLVGKASVLQELIDMEYSDIVEDEG